MQLTQKIRIFPSAEQIDVLWHLSERCRLVYNFALSERIEAFKNNKSYVSYFKQSSDLRKLKKQYTEYRYVYSKALQMILRTLDADYKSFYALHKKNDKSANPPRYKFKKYFTSMTYNQSGFKIKDNKLKLSHFYNGVELLFDIPENFKFNKIKQVTIFNKNNEFYLSIVHEVDAKKYKDNKKYQAIDLGVSKTVTAVNTKGKFFETINLRPDKYWNSKIDAIQSRRDHCIKFSRRWHRLNKALIRCRQKCSNQIKDYQHKLSRKMVDNTKANTFIIGDLNVKRMVENKKSFRKVNRSVQNQGYLNRFTRFLTYKAELVGKKVIEISEKDTSKMCCKCSKMHKMPLSKRNMNCDCGNNIDRDRNSAINIMVRYLSQNAKWTSYQQFVDNLRKTGLSLDNTLVGSSVKNS